ncbi:hypothetical protein BJ322DRAFT_1025573 [Thelephora terrestris]|uniref:SMODS and SLOG-associating 2TM effector domain-containing protein n=1 Tax=Thelephora terrestris TaxID=56493 RepID=A0A9P6H535_9AGAM|nr:hypothetical protein BJ322DRAFT_1025573 [Thelephora terrestris]
MSSAQSHLYPPVAVIEEPRGYHAEGQQTQRRIQIEPPQKHPAEPEPQQSRNNTLEDMLESTTAERDKSQKRSYRRKLLINGVVVFQAFFCILIIGAGAFSDEPIVCVLGGCSLLLALYLATVRAWGEPEFTAIRTREFNSLLGDLQTFIVDPGNKTGAEYDQQIKTFEERLGVIRTSARGSLWSND